MLLNTDFFRRDRLEVAPDLVGKLLVRRTENGLLTLRISETEAYGNADDTACHAHKGKTKRTAALYSDGGIFYVYLCYGMHWLLNVVTGEAEVPQGVLIRACVDANGPARLTKRLGITGEFNLLDACGGADLWFEDDGMRFEVLTDRRVGIGYASEEDQAQQWRFIMGEAITH